MNESVGERRGRPAVPLGGGKGACSTLRATMHIVGRSHRYTAPLLCGLVLFLLTACENPFRTSQTDRGPVIARERFRDITPISSDELRQAPTEQARSPLARPLDPFAGLTSTEFTIEQVRAWTLKNNLDLQVALVDPVIANGSAREEEARWESVFFSNMRFTNLDQPTPTTLVGGEVKQADIDFGVRVPMRTGGEVTVRLPVNRTKTDNQFSTLNPSITSDLELSITQPLLRNAGRRSNTHALRVASLNEGVAESRTKLEVIRQIAAADRAYWRLYAARRALDVAQQQYELASAQLDRARRRADVGDVAEIEIVRAEEGVAQRLEAIITSQNDVLLSQRDLKRIINLPGVTLDTPIMLVPSSDPAPQEFEFHRADLVNQAVDNRMELLELELQLAIDESTVAFERNRALPLFTLDYTYRINGLGGSFSEAFSLLSNADFRDWVLGLSAEIPLGNEAAKARVQRAILQRLQRLSSIDARRLSITQETLDAMDNIQSGWQRILAAAQSAILAARTLAAEERQFGVGRTTSTDVLDAATRLADAQLAEIRAVTDYEISKVDLAFATGTVLGSARVEWSPLNAAAEPLDEPAAPMPGS